MLKGPLIWSLVALVRCLGSVKAQCFNPDGSGIFDPAYQPCNQVDGTISQCCGTNHTGGISPDKCLANGLCQNTGDLLHWRNGCTDKTFKSPFCLNICLDGDKEGSSSENVPIISCSDGTWCCRTKSCCSVSSLKFKLAATIGISSTTSSSLRTTSTQSSRETSPPTSSLPTPSWTASQTSNPDTGLSSSEKIGLGVGIPIGILLIAGIIGFFMYLRRRDFKRFQEMTNPRSAGSGTGLVGVNGNMAANGNGNGNNGGAGIMERKSWFEMDGKVRAAEVQGDSRRYELASS